MKSIFFHCFHLFHFSTNLFLLFKLHIMILKKVWTLDYLLCDAFLKNSTTQFFNESGDSPSISSWTPSPSVIVIGPRCLVSNQVERFQNLYGSLFNDRFGNLIKSYFFTTQKLEFCVVVHTILYSSSFSPDLCLDSSSDCFRLYGSDFHSQKFFIL